MVDSEKSMFTHYSILDEGIGGALSMSGKPEELVMLFKLIL
jgi:hypothetical protein